MKPGWTGGESHSEITTMNFGRELSQFLECGDIIKLIGDLGSGKTTFVKGVAESMGYNGLVTSPTFTLINEYHCDPGIVHIDCYRETDIERWNLIGITDYFTQDKLIFIEWPEVLTPLIPTNGVFEIKFSHRSESVRSINLQ